MAAYIELHCSTLVDKTL